MTHVTTPALSVGSVTIRAHNGLYSLNDLHQTSGGEIKHQPANFIRLDTTQALIQELCSSDVRIKPVETVRGRGKAQGTYACRELVIAYAAWISAAFHLKVIRVFLDTVTPAQLPPAAPATEEPVVITPPEVQTALDAKAWELSAQAHRIIHRRLTGLVQSTVHGWPERTVDSDLALERIATMNLDDAFTPLQPDLHSMQLMAKTIAASAQRYADAVNAGITVFRQRDVLLAPVLNAAKDARTPAQLKLDAGARS